MDDPGTPALWAASARTLLFVPGDRPERFDKAVAAGADLVVLDLEDAVAPGHKEAARAHVRAWLERSGGRVAVRVNAAGTPWHAADITALSATPALVMLPKAEDPHTVTELVGKLAVGSAVIALVETARGVAKAADIAIVDGVHRLALGTYDLAAELGVDPDHGPALANVRSTLVLASAIARLAGPVDGVTGDVRDQDRLTADVRGATAIGFAGKLCIHPAQVTPAAAALAPTSAEVAWAERVLTAVRDADHGVVVVDGRMVDAPVIARARRLAGVRSV